MQGLSAGCMYVGSSDPVGVLRLSHNKYAGYTLKHLLLRHVQLVATETMCYSTC